MFDIVELDELICQQLNPHDLAQCARVSKQWHTLAIPFLWRNIQHFKGTTFFTMVLEDYSHKHGRRKLPGQEHDTEYPAKQSSPSLSALRKYGHLIERLPDPRELFNGFKASINLARTHQTDTDQIDGPIPSDLLRHLYTSCPNFAPKDLLLLKVDFESGGLIEAVAELVAPLVCHLRIDVAIRSLSQSKKLKYILDNCSSMLRRLDFRIDITYDDSEVVEQEQTEPKPWPNLNQLRILYSDDRTESKAFWSWLWKRCSNVETLAIGDIQGITRSLANGIAGYMTNLSKVHIIRCQLVDEEIATVISCSRQGWKDVEIMYCFYHWTVTEEALIRSCPTLESLRVDSWDCSRSDSLVRVLSSSPNLRTLDSCNRASCAVPASVFIDLDPNSGSLKPWKCESSLKELKIQISGIPRQGIKSHGAVLEEYPGQAQDMQNQVYARIGRLTNLEILWLHNRYKEPQHGCLDMSLESGLQQLSGLKALKELDVSCMRTKIGVNEVQWMIEHWPEIRAIYGLETKGHENEGAQWLRQHHPAIILK